MMEQIDISKKNIILSLAAAVFLLAPVFYFFGQLKPVSPNGSSIIFEISQGEGFAGIVNRLKDENIIRSTVVFEIYSVVTGSAGGIKPGIYEISNSSTTPQILDILSGQAGEIEVTVPDGASVYDIDALLAKKKVLPAGYLLSYAEKNDIEGMLYPDTYKFSEHSTAKGVVDKLTDNFHAKAESLLGADPIHFEANLILASLIQKEVSGEKDSSMVAGILKKRLSIGMALNVDATICFLKKKLNGQFNCYPLTQADLKMNSLYNTYLHAGLPPGPIGSPNEAAIKAVLNPADSPYWYYLNDPKTGKTIFSKTLEEQNANRRVYLK